MTVLTITGDEFALLDLADHRTAVRVYNTEIGGLIDSMAAAPDKQAPDYEEDSDELCRLLTLRKLHRGRLLELEGEEPAPRGASQQYFDNELRELPS